MTKELRIRAVDAFLKGVSAADPYTSLERHLDITSLQTFRRIHIIAIGKAAGRMMAAAKDKLSEHQIGTALVVTNYENVEKLEGVSVIGAAHPVPDANGLEASRQVMKILDDAAKDDLVLALISGGSSALLPAPVEGVSLDDKAEVNRILLGAGLDISQLNLVRQSLSILKGGGMLNTRAKVKSYILSDVVGDDLRVIGSGPTVGPIGTPQDAIDLLHTHHLFALLPQAVQEFYNRGEFEQKAQSDSAVLIGSNFQSLQAMAAELDAWIYPKPLEGDVKDAAATIYSEVNKNSDQKCLVFGGETTVNLKGTGRGGRNQELALHFAQIAQDLPGDWVFLSGGTDGRDGPTEAAGGIVDQDTISRINSSGQDLGKLLNNNDSFTALEHSGDLLVTGATGTNVADLQLFIRA